MSWRRLPFLLPAGLALLLGVDAGLRLLGAPALPLSQRLPVVHGPLLVLGFVGTLVALERAVALRRPAGYAAPALLGVGGLLLVAPLPLRAGQSLLTAGAAALAMVYVALWRRQRDDAVLIQALGAVLATGGALLWLGSVPVPRLLPWLAGFVVLTIAGERLELARLQILSSGSAAALVLTAAAVTVSAVASLLWPTAGFPLLGASLLILVGWLAVHDVARRTVRARGLPRFIAVCLLAGYAWLAVAGGTWLLAGPVLDGPAYDAAVHGVFLGFTLSMIMAHAPVILPAVLRVRLPYRASMYAPALLLQASLVVRALVGDAWGVEVARRAGGIGNAAAVLLFLGVMVWSASSRREPGPRRPTSGTPDTAPPPQVPASHGTLTVGAAR
ncbi:hypothetical protein SAMN05216199_0183 [Pedococcus cremeus]|uniref:NnrS family protein n=1 Tax=Pedococcus cremeus TaxID=587636 RepID=A0A1H9XSQ3_9MICO|nr:hypothetical protein [Pedococcus cremeus]SES48747.1 hypothetical protein SAMN05216199_0183 [Pedococcus cremeus]